MREEKKSIPSSRAAVHDHGYSTVPRLLWVPISYSAISSISAAVPVIARRLSSLLSTYSAASYRYSYRRRTAITIVLNAF